MATTDDELVTDSGMGARLKAAQDHLLSNRQETKAALRARDELIVEARDDLGWSHRQIARATGLAHSAVLEVLARS